jgi:hypothetical protein
MACPWVPDIVWGRWWLNNVEHCLARRKSHVIHVTNEDIQCLKWFPESILISVPLDTEHVLINTLREGARTGYELDISA